MFLPVRHPQQLAKHAHAHAHAQYVSFPLTGGRCRPLGDAFDDAGSPNVNGKGGTARTARNDDVGEASNVRLDASGDARNFGSGGRDAVADVELPDVIETEVERVICGGEDVGALSPRADSDDVVDGGESPPIDRCVDAGDALTEEEWERAVVAGVVCVDVLVVGAAPTLLECGRR